MSLTGGGSVLRGIAGALTEQIGLPTRVVDPLQHVRNRHVVKPAREGDISPIRVPSRSAWRWARQHDHRLSARTPTTAARCPAGTSSPTSPRPNSSRPLARRAPSPPRHRSSAHRGDLRRRPTLCPPVRHRHRRRGRRPCRRRPATARRPVRRHHPDRGHVNAIRSQVATVMQTMSTSHTSGPFARLAGHHVDRESDVDTTTATGGPSSGLDASGPPEIGPSPSTDRVARSTTCPTSSTGWWPSPA